jgi:hypothetical protein
MLWIRLTFILSIDVMMCGYLFIATDIGGHLDYIIDVENGFFSNEKNNKEVN